MPSRSGPEFAGVLFDLFGTLIPASPTSRRRPHLHEMARRLGVEPAGFETDWIDSFDDRARGRLGSLRETVLRLAERRGGRPTEAAVREAVEIRLGFTRSLLESCGPVLPALASLRHAGFRLAVVSDTSDETPTLWSSSRLAPMFDATVFSCEEGICKPEPGMYRTALGRLGLPPERCAYVGDGGSFELTGAAAVGLRPFLFRFPSAETEDARYRPDTEFRGPRLGDLGDLLGVLRPVRSAES